MKMQDWLVLVVLGLVVGTIIFAFSGCGQTGAYVDGLLGVPAQQPLEPGQQLLLVDEDQDGDVDVALVAEPDEAGNIVPITDEKGEFVEYEGSRERLIGADTGDQFISDTVTGWGAILGIPLAGLGGILWRTLRPSRKLVEGKLMFDELVATIQTFRKEQPEAAAVFDQEMADNGLIHGQSVKLEQAIKRSKAGI